MVYNIVNNIIEELLNSCHVSVRNNEGSYLSKEDIQEQMDIIGCRIEIKESYNKTNIILWINSWIETQYEIYLDLNNKQIVVKEIKEN